MEKLLERSFKYMLSFWQKESVKIRAYKPCVRYLFFEKKESVKCNYIILVYSDGSKRELLVSKDTEKHLDYILSVIGIEASFVHGDKIMRFRKKGLMFLEIEVSRLS